jgi:hypothetical protein
MARCGTEEKVLKEYADAPENFIIIQFELQYLFHTIAMNNHLFIRQEDSLVLLIILLLIHANFHIRFRTTLVLRCI